MKPMHDISLPLRPLFHWIQQGQDVCQTEIGRLNSGMPGRKKCRTRTYTKFVLQSPDDWQKLRPRDVTLGRLGQQLQCLDRLQQAFGNETPYIQTIFSPLSQAKNLAGREWLLSHIHQNPQAVLAGLEVITQTTIAFLEAACARGIAGIFYAVQHASYQYFDKAGYGMFGEVFDCRVLEAANGLWLNVLHMHGEQLMFDIAATYPVQVVHWHDRQTPLTFPWERLPCVLLCAVVYSAGTHWCLVNLMLSGHRLCKHWIQ